MDQLRRQRMIQRNEMTVRDVLAATLIPWYWEQFLIPRTFFSSSSSLLRFTPDSQVYTSLYHHHYFTIRCVRCGGTGHISSECFFRIGEKKYELLTDYDDVMDAISSSSSSSSMPDTRHQPPLAPPRPAAAVGRGRGAVMPAWLQDQGKYGGGNISSSSSSSNSNSRHAEPDMTDRGVGRGRGAVVPAWMVHGGASTITITENFGNRSIGTIDEKDKDSKKHKKEHKKEKKEKKEHKKHHHKEKKKKHKSKEDKKKEKKRRYDDDDDERDTDAHMQKHQRNQPSDESSSSSSDDD